MSSLVCRQQVNAAGSPPKHRLVHLSLVAGYGTVQGLVRSQKSRSRLEAGRLLPSRRGRVTRPEYFSFMAHYSASPRRRRCLTRSADTD